jgi:hypothetical protein
MQPYLKHKILIYLAVWKRPEITEICFQGIERLRKFGVDCLAVISEDDMIPLCEKYGIDWVFYKNNPLGEKKNAGLKVAKDLEWDYILEIGSDDILLDEIFELYANHMGVEDFFGVKDIAFINSDDGHCRRFTSKVTFGAGRMMSRKVFEAINWVLWPNEVHLGLDNSSVAKITNAGFKYKQVQCNTPVVIDIKSEQNIWKFNYFLGVEYDVNLILDKVSEQEKQGLLALWQQR